MNKDREYRDLPITISQEEKAFLCESGHILRDAKRLDEALATFEGVLPLVQDKYLALVGIGSVHFRKGDLREAIDAFEEATRLNPESALAYAHLGEALAFAREGNAAAIALRKASDLDPSGESGGELARTLQRFIDLGLIT